MKRCPKCSKTYADDSLSYCLTDGEALLSEAALYGTTLVSDAVSLGAQTPAMNSQMKTKPTGSKLPLLAVLGIVILGVLAGSYLYFYGGQTTSSKRETNQNALGMSAQPSTPPPAPSQSVTQTPTETAGMLPTPSPSPTTSETPLATPEASPVTPTATPATPSEQNVKSKVESQFFTFDLKRCRLSGATVACELVITNNDRDRKLTIRGSSTIFDQEGNQYRAGKMQLANQDNSYSVGSYLISGVATKARVTFDGVSPTATKLSLLQLNLDVEDSPDFNVQYRNVPLK